MDETTDRLTELATYLERCNDVSDFLGAMHAKAWELGMPERAAMIATVRSMVFAFGPLPEGKQSEPEVTP